MNESLMSVEKGKSLSWKMRCRMLREREAKKWITKAKKAQHDDDDEVNDIVVVHMSGG